MGDSASRSTSRAPRTRSGGAARPPSSPARRRRTKTAPQLASSTDPESPTKHKERSSGSSRSRTTRQRPKAAPSSVIDEESPSKRPNRSTKAAWRRSPKKTVARDVFSADSEAAVGSEFDLTADAFQKQLKLSWIALHGLQQDDDFPVADDDFKDEICLVCRQPDQLTFCTRCVHGVCVQCVTIDAGDRQNWCCSSTGLRCTRRRDRRQATVVDVPPTISVPPGSKKILKLKTGDFVEIPSHVTPGFVKSRAWAPDYDSDAEPSDQERLRSYFAQVVKFDKKLVDVYFLIYPDRNRIPTRFANELFLTTSMYTIPRVLISGMASKPIVFASDAEAPNLDCFIVRLRYDMVRLILRPLLDDASSPSVNSDIVVDLRESDSGTDPTLSHIEKAVRSLQLSSAPEKLPCRDRERDEIERILGFQMRVGGGSGGGLYISGLPGTGKTATVRRVIRGLQDGSSLPPFKYVEINALKLQAPRYAYVQLWKAISRQHCSPFKALAELEKYYRSARRRRRQQMVVLVLDEFDYLVEGKTNNVIYNLFSFPAEPKSGLIVIGIANTLDLPERMGGREFSRLGLQCINFEPYTAVQVEEIIMERLKGMHLFVDQNAVTLCAKSIASTSGDLRRALQIISTAIELCAADGGKLTIDHVTTASSKFNDTPAIQFFRGGAILELGLICAVFQELKQSERHEAEYDAVVRRLSRLLKSRGHEVAPSIVIDRIIHALADNSVITLCRQRDSVRPNIRPYASVDDIMFALKETVFSDVNL